VALRENTSSTATIYCFRCLTCDERWWTADQPPIPPHKCAREESPPIAFFPVEVPAENMSFTGLNHA
jgi:hypothetical protein